MSSKKPAEYSGYTEEMMHLAVEASPNGMVMMNRRGDIVLVNSTTEDLFGYRREELIGRSIEILVPERFRDKHPVLRQGYYRQPRSRAMGQGRDLYGLHASGKEFPVEIGLNPIQTPQGVMVLSSIVDITERKLQEQQIMAALKEKELMLAEIHHRVKNNLQIIDSLLGMQSDRLVDSKVISVLRESQNRVKSMALIHQTLYESLDFSQVDITNVIRSLVDSLCNSYAVDVSKIKVIIEIDQVYLSIDTSIPLGLIINELCSNAMKHAFRDRSTGTIKLTLKYMDDGNLQLVVSDDGIGIPEDFEIENATSLGLQLIQLLTEQISAELAIQRRNPTRFLINIPNQR